MIIRIYKYSKQYFKFWSFFRLISNCILLLFELTSGHNGVDIIILTDFFEELFFDVFDGLTHLLFLFSLHLARVLLSGSSVLVELFGSYQIFLSSEFAVENLAHHFFFFLGSFIKCGTKLQDVNSAFRITDSRQILIDRNRC